MDERGAPLDYEVAHRTIRRRLNEDCLVISDHAWEQMKMRQIDDQDVWKVLTYGSVTGHRWEGNSCRYQVEGYDMEGLRRFPAKTIPISWVFLPSFGVAAPVTEPSSAPSAAP